MTDQPPRTPYSHLTPVPADARDPGATIYTDPNADDPDDDDDDLAGDWYRPTVDRDDLDTRMRGAIAGVAAWYRNANAAVGEEESFYWGRQLYHAMRPIDALDRKLRGLPPEHPCTRCGTEEGGASVNVPKPGDSLCAWCAGDAWGEMHAADGET